MNYIAKEFIHIKFLCYIVAKAIMFIKNHIGTEHELGEIYLN